MNHIIMNIGRTELLIKFATVFLCYILAVGMVPTFAKYCA